MVEIILDIKTKKPETATAPGHYHILIETVFPRNASLPLPRPDDGRYQCQEAIRPKNMTHNQNSGIPDGRTYYLMWFQDRHQCDSHLAHQKMMSQNRHYHHNATLLWRLYIRLSHRSLHWAQIHNQGARQHKDRVRHSMRLCHLLQAHSVQFA